MKYVWITLYHVRISHCSWQILERKTNTNEIIVNVKLSEDYLGMSLRSHPVLLSLWFVNECHWRPSPGVNLCMYTFIWTQKRKKKNRNVFLVFAWSFKLVWVSCRVTPKNIFNLKFLWKLKFSLYSRGFLSDYQINDKLWTWIRDTWM